MSYRHALFQSIASHLDAGGFDVGGHLLAGLRTARCQDYIRAGGGQSANSLRADTGVSACSVSPYQCQLNCLGITTLSDPRAQQRGFLLTLLM